MDPLPLNLGPFKNLNKKEEPKPEEAQKTPQEMFDVIKEVLIDFEFDSLEKNKEDLLHISYERDFSSDEFEDTLSYVTTIKYTIKKPTN